MASILLVNPRRRRRRKLSAKQRKYFGKRRKRRSSAVASNPRRRRRRSNPSYRRSRRRRNPSIRGAINSVQPTVKSGIVGAVGALGLDVALGYLLSKLPAQLQTGYGLTATKVLGAIGVGILGNMVLKGKGNALALGAMTVVLHDEAKKLVVAQFPDVPMGDMGEYMSIGPVVGYDEERGISGMGEYMSGTGEYVSDSDDQGGYG